MPESADPTLTEERRYHAYRGNEIPVYVRLLWVGFYALAIVYCLYYLFPAIRSEFRPRGEYRNAPTTTVEPAPSP